MSPKNKSYGVDIEIEEVSDDSIETGLNGLSDAKFSFTCTHREYDAVNDTYRYLVEPDAEYDDLDFKGHDVLINDVIRRCVDFEINDDGHLIIVVNYVG